MIKTSCPLPSFCFSPEPNIVFFFFIEFYVYFYWVVLFSLFCSWVLIHFSQWLNIIWLYVFRFVYLHYRHSLNELLNVCFMFSDRELNFGNSCKLSDLQDNLITGYGYLYTSRICIWVIDSGLVFWTLISDFWGISVHFVYPQRSFLRIVSVLRVGNSRRCRVMWAFMSLINRFRVSSHRLSFAASNRK